MDNSDSPFANFKGGSSGSGRDGGSGNGAGHVVEATDNVRWKRPLRPYEERGDPERLIEFSGEFVGDAKVEKSNPFQSRYKTQYTYIPTG